MFMSEIYASITLENQKKAILASDTDGADQLLPVVDTSRCPSIFLLNQNNL